MQLKNSEMTAGGCKEVLALSRTALLGVREPFCENHLPS